MRNRLILLLLLCATGAAAQIPTLTNAAKIRYVQGNTVFDRPASDLLALVGAENISVSGDWTFSSNLTQLKDAGTYFYDDGDNTKLFRFQASGISTATTRNYTMPNADGTLALTSDIPSLPVSVGNGGTGATSLTNNRLLTGNGTSAIVDEANLTFDGTTHTITGKSAWNIGGSYSSSQNFVNQTGTVTSTANSLTHYGMKLSPVWENDGILTGNSYATMRIEGTIANPTASSGYYGMNFFLTNSSPNVSIFRGLTARIDETSASGDLSNRYGMYFEVIKNSAAFDSHTGGGILVDVKENSASGRWKTATGIIANAANAITAQGISTTITSNRNTGNTQRGIITTNNVSGAGVVVDNAYGIDLRSAASSSGIITNYYGIYQNTIPAGATNTYFLYGSQSGAHSYLSGSASLGVNSTAAKLTVRGTGTTSGTTPFLVENSSGTDIVVVTDDQMSAIGTATVSTQKLTVRGATSDNTAKAFVAERSSGTDVLGVQNDGKVSINNAAYTEELTINGQAQLDGVIFTNVTGSTTASGHMVYTDDATHGGYVTIGDGDRQLALMPTMIERDVIDYNVDWTTGRKGSFWTVPARFNGWKISKAYVGITNIGSGAGDDELTIEIGGVGEGVQIVTAGTHTLVMDDVINTDDIITFNVTAISATPAKGLNVALELSKN